MATLVKQPGTITGLVPVLAAATAGGDDVAPGEHTYVMVKNADSTSTTVTVVVPGAKFGQQNPDVPVMVAAAATALIGPLVGDLRGVNGRVGLTYSKVVSLTIGALEL